MMQLVQSKSVRILLVEDDEVDVMGIKRCFRDLKIANEIVVARDGLEALDMLRGRNGVSKLAHPYVILLDLSMPRMNGFEFLQEVRRDPELQRVVVFVLTTSRADEDLLGAYSHNVAGYVVKQQAGKGFLDAVSLIDHYWRVVELP
jgi:CheY-like chemotaxis protein